MLYKFCTLFSLFMFYSILGYIVEIICCSIYNKKIILNRGFLIGPYLPIYGVSCIAMDLLLVKYEDDLIVLAIMSMLICSIIEFVTSYILEKIFKVRWWDYSQRRFNIEGRICLFNSFLFGLGGLLLVRVINPFIKSIILGFSKTWVIIISLIIMLLFITDIVISVITLSKIKILSHKYCDHDATDDIKKRFNETLKKNSFLLTKLLNAFPKISGKNKDIIVEIKKKANKFRKKLKEKNQKLKEKRKK